MFCPPVEPAHNSSAEAEACELRGARAHPQEAPAKIDNALIAVGEELRFDLVKTVAVSGDNAGLAQNGEMFRDQC